MPPLSSPGTPPPPHMIGRAPQQISATASWAAPELSPPRTQRLGGSGVSGGGQQLFHVLDSDCWLVRINGAKEVTAGSSVHPRMAATMLGPAWWWGIISYRSHLPGPWPLSLLEFGELLRRCPASPQLFVRRPGRTHEAHRGRRPYPSMPRLAGSRLRVVPTPKATRASAWPVVGGCRQ